MTIIDIIKYEGNNKEIVWKHPGEEFSNVSELRVNKNQDALLVRKEQVLDLFSTGQYTLNAQSAPILSSALNIKDEEKSSFNCEIYFLNKSEEIPIKWRTDKKVQFMEPTYGFPVSIGAYGEMSLVVVDSRKFLNKYVNNEQNFNKKALYLYIKSFLKTRIKVHIANLIINKYINIFEIDENLSCFSEQIKEELILDLQEHGITLSKFVILNIATPDDMNYSKYKELYLKKLRM